MRNDELDSILESALASYSLGEPRAGLPVRVMARVHSENGASRSRWWVLAVAAVALACVTVVMVTQRPRPAEGPVARPAEVVAPAVVKNLEHPPGLPHQALTRQVTHKQPKRLPRLESFPGPAPLTAEERALLAFAQQAPEVARQVARLDDPLEIKTIEIRPLQPDGPETGEIQ